MWFWYFPKSFEAFGGDINVKVDLCNYATKADVENISQVDTSIFALKSNLASLKTEIDKLDFDKLASLPVDLIKLRDVFKNDVVKKTVYDKLVAKVNSIDTNGFVLKTKYDTGKAELENKITDTSGPVENARGSAMLKLLKQSKILSISGLATTSALTAVESKMYNISSLVKKADYDAKITEIEKKTYWS